MPKPKRKKRVKLLTLSVTALLFSSSLYIGSSLVLRSYNNYVAKQQQELETQIKELQTTNDSLSIEVSGLTNSERVRGIAEDESLSFMDSIVITITTEDNSETQSE